MKYVVLTKRTLPLALMAFCLTVFAVAAAAQGLGYAVSVMTRPRRLPIYCVDRQDKVVALSFDAAWGNEDTEMLIEILGRYGAKATFFVVGQWVDKYPESVKALHDAGHSIQNHSNAHPHMPKLSKEKMAEEIGECDKKIEAITGKKPFLFRPPYGDYNNALIEVLEEMGHYCIQWDVDSLDWKDVTAEQIRQRVTERVKPGSIVLFHNAAKNTPAALPGILEDLKGKGYSFVLIEDLIYRDNYYIDHTGKQILKKEPSDSQSSSEG